MDWLFLLTFHKWGNWGFSNLPQVPQPLEEAGSGNVHLGQWIWYVKFPKTDLKVKAPLGHIIYENCSYVHKMKKWSPLTVPLFQVRKGFTVVRREPAAWRGSCMRQAIDGYQVLMMVIASVGQSKVPLEGWAGPLPRSHDSEQQEIVREFQGVPTCPSHLCAYPHGCLSSLSVGHVLLWVRCPSQH